MTMRERGKTTEERKTKPFSVLLKDREHFWLKSMSEDYGVSAGVLVRCLMDEWIGNPDVKNVVERKVKEMELSRQ